MEGQTLTVVQPRESKKDIQEWNLSVSIILRHVLVDTD